VEHSSVSAVALSLARGDVTVGVVPERGALVTSIVVSGKELLYLDRATLDDPTKNVRGGIPVLFPYAGKLVDGRLTAAGTTMGQHGFGRNRPWLVQEKGAGEARLRLVQDPETRSQFPYDYEADYVVTVLPRGAEVRLRVENTGGRPIPLSPGWHPYFRCAARMKARVSGTVAGFTADKLGDDREFDFGLLPPPSGRTEFHVPELGTVSIEFSPKMRHMQFWSQPGKDFICLEPFYGPANTINTDARLDVPVGAFRELWMRLELGRSAPSAGQ
jgi:galactose mutarotase-like enzyme